MQQPQSPLQHQQHLTFLFPSLQAFAAATLTALAIGALFAAGRMYKPNATRLTCIAPLELCSYNFSNHTQFIIRCVALGIWSIWYFVLVFQGLRDMARMPYETFR